MASSLDAYQKETDTAYKDNIGLTSVLGVMIKPWYGKVSCIIMFPLLLYTY